MKKIFLIFTLGIVFIGVGMLFSRLFEKPAVVVIGNKALESLEWPQNLNFAGESVPLDDFYVREAWERDFLILVDTPHQSLLYLKRSGKYFPFIEAELERRGLPQDLKYIAVAESALIEDSTSSAGARGIWQFMPNTGRQYGLTVDSNVDERLNFEKATISAFDYLEFLYEKFDNWSLAAAAYNAGHNRILGHLFDQEVISYYDLYMNAETSRYLFRILAIKTIMESPEDYGLTLRDPDYFAWPSLRRERVSGIEDLSQWALDQRTHLKFIKELNPWISGNSLPLGEWEIKIPQ
jgi:membrane-bound lytic murein transglycosylase D